MSEMYPEHVGIIMDGNGRWALERKLNRTDGHIEGLKVAKDIVGCIADLKIPYVSLYTFSTENWKRTREEVVFLLKIIAENLKKEDSFYKKHNIKIVHSGSRSNLPQYVLAGIDWAKDRTKHHTGLTVNIAINYGGRDEIVRAVNAYMVENGNKSVTQEKLMQYFDLPNIPDPDIIIRTAGEYRLSNFLLWQSAYSELYFSSKLWPDWTVDDLMDALDVYRSRHRKFGEA